MARFPYEKALMEFLCDDFDVDDSLRLIEETISNYDSILQNTSKAEHGKEWGVFQKRIAPGVAFYKTLRAQSIEEAERSIMSMVFLERLSSLCRSAGSNC